MESVMLKERTAGQTAEPKTDEQIYTYGIFDDR